jgi:hypothetical protein
MASCPRSRRRTPRRRRAGIVEFGLPYPSDAAITRHLAAFLQRHAGAARAALGDAAPATAASAARHPAAQRRRVPRRADRPAAGGHPRPLARRPAAGAPQRRPRPGRGPRRGGLGLARTRGSGPAIGGGSARSYFLLLDEGGDARRGVCVLPRGTEAGHEVHLPGRSFALRLGQAVRFQLVSSVGDTPWQAGELVEAQGDDFVRLPPIATVLPAAEGAGRRDVVVQLTATMTEVGTLEMHCVSADDPARRWLLAFQLRGEAAASPEPPAAAEHPRLPAALAEIERVFGGQSKQVDAREVRGLRARLERLLGPREAGICRCCGPSSTP